MLKIPNNSNIRSFFDRKSMLRKGMTTWLTVRKIFEKDSSNFTCDPKTCYARCKRSYKYMHLLKSQFYYYIIIYWKANFTIILLFICWRWTTFDFLIFPLDVRIGELIIESLLITIYTAFHRLKLGIVTHL